MRPEILFPIFKPVTSLKGVGPRIGKLIESLTGPKVVDILWHMPNEVIDRRYSPKLIEAKPGQIGTIVVEVLHHAPPPHKRLPYKVYCSDNTGKITLVFFHSQHKYLKEKLPIGATKVVSGKIEKFENELQITHPDYIVSADELLNLKKLEPVYPLTAGLTLKTFGKAISSALDFTPSLGEWIDPNLISTESWPSWREALLAVHKLETRQLLDPLSPPRMRLAYDELLANQIALALMRREMRLVEGRSFDGDGNLSERVVNTLPFSLTNSQKNALAEIRADMVAKRRMLRLLQGDVGSGKTIVAFLAMLTAIECGAQAALMAPTEILAKQHFSTLQPIAEAVGVKVFLLTGRDKGRSRDHIIKALASGEASLAIGTHALFQGDVKFNNLGISVIDEQHRFGVHQRLNLLSKGRGVDIIVMTATPIPRTLMLTVYGDMDVSLLLEKPAGRLPVDTRTIPLDRLHEIAEAVGRSLQSGAKIYWVCPLVDESNVMDLAAAEKRFEYLNLLFPDRVGLIHGKMKSKEKDNVMVNFSNGPFDILVATTVIEVGLDVTNANVMIVEHAERFGLAQLHQLRGRVGRGSKHSNCILLYSTSLSDTARARLSILRETDNGFRIAEEDLKLRGGGEILGTQQSGVQKCRLANLSTHGNLLKIAKKDAEIILNRDPELKSPRGNCIRILLYLFNEETAVDNLRSG